jgi:hypothetical protein
VFPKDDQSYSKNQNAPQLAYLLCCGAFVFYATQEFMLLLSSDDLLSVAAEAQEQRVPAAKASIHRGRRYCRLPFG